MTVLTQFGLEGRNAVVTGASRGLGRAAAIALAEAGASLGLCARSTAGLAETADLVEQASGRRPFTASLDVTDPDGVAEFMRAAVAELGTVDVLLNNAGTERQAFLTELSYEDWRAVMDTNLDAVFLFCREFARLSERGGSIINISSISATAGIPAQSAYCASKGGVASLTRALAVELARHDIRVNALAPGYFRTDMPASVLADETATKKLLSQVPARRVAEPAEIGPPVVFLASEASRFMTGAVVPFDGGYTAR